MLKVLSVTELSGYVTGIFEAEELLHNLQVYGEASNISFVRGNIYFNLKDENALLPCIMFGASSCNIKEGDQVLLNGGLKYYSKGGKLNFYATSISPYGSGILYQKFLVLKEQLEKDGVFDAKHKKPLPKTIKKIGVVTSSTGAVLHDIETVSHRRNPALEIVVYPARVQGEGAEKTIINGIKYFDKKSDVDVIIIARGGGSIEDLQPFNTEALAREIITVSKPIISAVGHETDFTICDFASSIRAATPSEAAELVSTNVFEKMNIINNMIDKIYFAVCNIIDEKYRQFARVAKMLGDKFNAIFDRQRKSFDKTTLKLSMLNVLDKYQNNFILCQEKLFGLNPALFYDKGYAKIVRDNKFVRSKNDLSVGDNIEIEFPDGRVGAVVNKKEN